MLRGFIIETLGSFSGEFHNDQPQAWIVLICSSFGLLNMILIDDDIWCQPKWFRTPCGLDRSRLFHGQSIAHLQKICGQEMYRQNENCEKQAGEFHDITRLPASPRTATR